MGVGVQPILEWYGMFYGREFIGGEIKVYCDVKFEQNVTPGLLK